MQNTTTMKRYLFDAALTGNATITDIGTDDRGTWVRLSETLFHPQGGGQRADKGSIGGIEVLHVAHDDGCVRHYVASLDFAVGDAVALDVNAAWRTRNARLHSGGHALAGIVERLGPGIRAVAAHHWPGQSRIEFVGDLDSAPPIEDVRKAINAAVAEAWPVVVRPDSRGVRQVQIGNLDAVGCGGTHVRSLDEVGQVDVTRMRIKSKKLRVSYDVGESDGTSA